MHGCIKKFSSIITTSALTALLMSTPHALATSSEVTVPTTTEAEVVKPPLSPLASAIEQRLALLPAKTKSQKNRAAQITEWYAARNYSAAWNLEGEGGKGIEPVIYKLLTAYEDGLIASDYDASKLFSLMRSPDIATQADFDVSLSIAAIRFGQHLFSGRVTPNSINREVVIYPKKISAQSVLDQLTGAESPADTLANMTPETPRYDRLKQHLLALRLLDAQGGYTTFPKGEVLKPGMTDSRLDALRARLQQSRDLPKGAHSGDVYDGKLVEAVKYYQWRNGLAIDGVVGPGTGKQLNVDIKQRIQQVELNLERRRWMQNDYGKRYIFVNLADQVLKLVEDGKTTHAEIVQVGLPYHRTPVFTDEMKYVEFNPYWNVPYSIATKEYLPKLKRNAYALQAQNIRVLRGGRSVSPGSVPWSSYSRARFPVRLRQEPGPRNALGRVKFMFPNKYNIYIHDTPSKSKFKRSQRYFSHGCIRLNRPFQFAQKLMSGQMSQGKMSRIRKSGKRTVVNLTQSIPVHITYLTAWVNKDGSAHYREDVYGRDKILQKALEKSG